MSSDETPVGGSSFSLAHWLRQPDPLLLPILARHVPVGHVLALAQMADIAGSRGGVSPPWPPLAEHVSRALAERWSELDGDVARGVLESLPRTGLFLGAEQRDAVPAEIREALPCVEAAIVHAGGDSDRARSLAEFLLRERGQYDRRGLSLLVAAGFPGAQDQYLQAVLDDRSEYALEGWLDLAAAGLLTDPGIYQIELALRERLPWPGVSVAALLGPALGDRARARPFARHFVEETPGGLPDWCIAAMLSRAAYAFDPSLLAPWTAALNEPYRTHVQHLLERLDSAAADEGAGSLYVLLRSHPAAIDIQPALAALGAEEAAALSANAVDLIFDLWAGAGPPPPMSDVAAPSAPPPLARRGRSVFDRFRAILRRSRTEPGERAAPPADDEPLAEMEDVAEEAAAEVQGEASGVEAEGSPAPPDRFVQAAVVYDGERRLSFVAGVKNEVLCWIGPDEKLDPRPRTVAHQPVREGVVPDTGLSLDVVLSYEGQTQVRSILLPKDRRSRTADCYLAIDVPMDETHLIAEIAFLHKGRVFEVVRLDGPVVGVGERDPEPGLRLKVLAQRRQDIELSDREAVDAVVVSEGDEVKVFGPRGAARFTLASTAPAIEWLNKEIFATEKSLVRRQAGDGLDAGLMASDDETLKFLRGMALHGNSLYKELREQGFVDPGERIQLMNIDPGSYVPLEFVYDRGHPVEGATLCSGWREALAGDDARCPVCKPAWELTLAERDAMAEICPLGFWSLQKIIERHDASLDVERAKVSMPVDGADLLPPISSALFASSFRVLEEDRDRTAAVLESCVENAFRVTDWSAWKDVVRQQHPQLFVAMPHHSMKHAIDTLEIGDGQELSQDRLSELYVTSAADGPGPIVVLFGCETQRQAEMGYVSFGRDFARNRAAVVVGTMAKVLGRHAAPVAQCLIREFTVVSERSRVGLLMRRIRRRMLAQGYLMALCLVALGDGDWWLNASGPAQEEQP